MKMGKSLRIARFREISMFYALFSDIVIADPSLMEERRSEATVVFGLNSYRELCGLHFGGITLASLEVLIRCANLGAKRAKTVVKQIKTALHEDQERRYNSSHHLYFEVKYNKIEL